MPALPPIRVGESGQVAKSLVPSVSSSISGEKPTCHEDAARLEGPAMAGFPVDYK